MGINSWPLSSPQSSYLILQYCDTKSLRNLGNTSHSLRSNTITFVFNSSLRELKKAENNDAMKSKIIVKLLKNYHTLIPIEETCLILEKSRLTKSQIRGILEHLVGYSVAWYFMKDAKNLLAHNSINKEYSPMINSLMFKYKNKYWDYHPNELVIANGYFLSYIPDDCTPPYNSPPITEAQATNLLNNISYLPIIKKLTMRSYFMSDKCFNILKKSNIEIDARKTINYIPSNIRFLLFFILCILVIGMPLFSEQGRIVKKIFSLGFIVLFFMFDGLVFSQFALTSNRYFVPLKKFNYGRA